MVVGIAPGDAWGYAGLATGAGGGRADHARPLRGGGRHRHGLSAGRSLRIRRNSYTVVGLTRRMVSSSGDPMVFIPLKDAQEAQFLKDNDAIGRAAVAPKPTRLQPARRPRVCCWMP
jgi:putative ABC transport system permease protein